MAINRYVDVNFDQPVSNYVPLPLEMLYKLGKDASKDYEDALKGIEDSKGILGKHKTRTSVKVYDPNKGGVVDAQIDFEPQRQAYQAKLQSEMESITNDYIKDKDTNKFKQRMSSLKNNAVAMNNDLAVKSAIIDKIDKHNEEIAKNEEFGNYNFLGDEFLKYNTKFYNQYTKDPNKIGDYSGYDIAKKVDRPKEIKETFGSLGEEVLQSFADPDGKGYLREKYREGRTKSKIDSVFNPWYENSNTKKEIEHEASYFFNSTGIDPNKIVQTIKTKDGKVINITAYDEFESQKIAELANIARGYVSSKGKDNISIDSNWARLEDEKKKQVFASSLTGSTVESNTFDLASLDPNYKALKDLGVYKEDKNGVISVNWGKGAAGKGVKITNFGGLPIASVYDNSNISDDQLKSLVKETDRMARAIGWYNVKDKLEADDFGTIATAYNLMSKSRLAGEQLNPVIAKMKTEEVYRNYDNYQSYDPQNIDNPSSSKPSLYKDGDKGELNIQNRLTNSKGESIITGTVRYSDGTTAPVALRSGSKQEDIYFNEISNIASNAVKYIVGTSKPIETVQSNGKTYHIVDRKTLPGSGIKVEVVADPNTKMKQEYIVEIPKDKVTDSMLNDNELITTKDGSKIGRFESFAEAQLFLNNSWYTSTNYGQSEISQLESDQKKSENYTKK